MPRDKLRRLVAELHGELEHSGPVDEESRELLHGLTADIEELVGHDEPPQAHRESAVEQVSEAAVHFQAEHPQVSRLLREIVDALGRLGI